MGKTLFIVESKTKAEQIAKKLGAQYIVRFSGGHVRDLPKEYGVDLAKMEESYVPIVKKGFKPLLPDLRKLAHSKEVDHVILATDPDREGEAIAWHLMEEMRLKNDRYSRITYNEVTEAAIRAALNKPRKVNFELVDAQRSRRVLDRIVGYDVSADICWPAGAASAGRVQTPALHILCMLEERIRSFVSEDYFTLSAQYQEGFSAFVPANANDAPSEVEEGAEEGGEPTGDSGDEGKSKGRIVPRKFKTKEEAESARQVGLSNPHVVRDVVRDKTKRSPNAPYITSTLQQDGSKKLGLSVKQTMDLAQTLFEHGLITYHRTDSPHIAEDGVKMAREYISLHHPEALAPKSPVYRGKANAQEGHEAIRPTGLNTAASELPKGTERLYAMIKARFLASQCKPAEFDKTVIWINSGPLEWVAIGSVMTDPGFLVFWGDFASQEDERLPVVQPQQQLGLEGIDLEAKKTQPPSRLDEGDFVKKLENSGIGRPSTYAATVNTLKQRGYIQEIKAGRGKKMVLQPTDLGLNLDRLLTEVFPDLVSTEYTARMEESLDEIEAGRMKRVDFLRDFYSNFRGLVEAAKPRAADFCKKNGLGPKTKAGKAQETETPCDRCGKENYREIPRKSGGSFLACPSCEFSRDLKAGVKPGACPKEGCGGNLVERQRKDKKGTFFACAQEGCNHIESATGEPGGRYVTLPQEGRMCPKCEKLPLVLKKFEGGPENATKKDFYACAGTEKRPRGCGFTLDFGAKQHPDPCERCGSVVLERTSKEGVPYWACAKHHHFRSERYQVVVLSDRKCPKCEQHCMILNKRRDPESEGNDYYGCAGDEKNPKGCGFTLTYGARKHPVNCEHCGGIVLERTSKQGKRYWACAKCNKARFES